MWNASLAFRILTWYLSKSHPDILNFDKPTEMLTKEKRLKWEFCIWIFHSKFELRIPLVFRVSDTFRSEY